MFSNIKEALNFVETQKRNEKKENLDYMYKLCSFFNNPQEGLKYIHIGGTNGKGSTVNYITNILIDAGYNVASYVSPYIICFNERISYNTKYISDDDLLHYINLVVDRYDELQSIGIRRPGFFELVTLIAFLYFKDLKPDVVVLEVGIGGTLDSTNVINPLIAGITNVSYDHMNILGNTLEEIWKNKLGIAKKETLLITWDSGYLNDLIISEINKKKSKVFLIDKNNINNVTSNLNGTIFSYKDFDNIELQMLGKYQTENATIALEIVSHLKQFNISKENIYNGLKNTFWPGRLEIISKDPLIILDGAHNIDGVERLKEFIVNIKKNNYIRLIMAISSNKEKEKMIHCLENTVDEMIFTEFSYKRSDEGINLYNFCNHKNKYLINDINEIISLTYKEKDKVNIYCGSLYFVSELKKLLKKDLL